MKNPILIEGELPFQVDRHSFCVDAPQDAVVVQVSVSYLGTGDPDDFSWFNYSDQIPANDGPIEVTGIAAGLWWRLQGSTHDVLCRF